MVVKGLFKYKEWIDLMFIFAIICPSFPEDWKQSLSHCLITLTGKHGTLYLLGIYIYIYIPMYWHHPSYLSPSASVNINTMATSTRKFFSDLAFN